MKKTYNYPKAFIYMKRSIMLAVLVTMCTLNAVAQFAVTTNGGSGLAATYPSLAAAITDLNAAVITSPVIITCPTGTETSPAGGYVITAQGTSTNTIIIEGNGVANSIITAPTNHTVGALQDAIFKLVGADFVTLQGFAMNENAANIVTAAASNTMTEFGVALQYATTTNGAQNNTIQNNSITLVRTYQNTFGIYCNSTHSTTSITTSASATTAAGGNSGLKVYGNTISNVNQGICVVGPLAAVDMNTGIDIGGTSPSQGNTITNWGTTGTFSGYVNVSGTLNGILIRNSVGYNVSNNTITSSVGGNTVTASQRGIFVPAFTVAPTGTFTNSINNNNISIQSGIITGTLNGIICEGTSGTATSTLNINGNNFNTFGHTVAGTGACTFISNVMAHQFVTINSNTFTNITLNTTGTVTFISHGYSIPTNGSLILNGNSIVTGFTRTSPGATTISTSNSVSGTGSIQNYINNNFSNMTFAGAGTILGFNNTDGGTGSAKTITGNTFNNWSGATGTINCMNFTYWNGVSSLSNNTITNISGQGAITGVTVGATANNATSITIANNTIQNLISSGTGGAVTGMTVTNTSPNININNNTISGLSSTGASTVTGISRGGASVNNIFKNTICDLSGSNASSIVYGLNILSGTVVTVSNNRIGNLTAPNANAANPVVGINVAGGTTVNLYYNTVLLNASSTGALFGSSAISASTAVSLTLNNNVFVNKSTPNGAGLSVAYRRSTATLTSYTSSSNRNDFFASTVYTDGITPQATLAAYQSAVTPRDAASVSLDPTFLSTTCGAADFLKIDASAPTSLESGGSNITGISDDFENEIRAGNAGYAGTGSAPDMGADEFNGISYAPTITNLVLSSPGTVPQCFATPRDVFADVTTAFGSITAVDLNYSFNGVAQTPIPMTNIGGDTYTGQIPTAVPGGATVTWSVSAINDLNGTSSIAGSSYADEILSSMLVTASAGTNPLCDGSASVLTVNATYPSDRILGAGAILSTTYHSPYYNLFNNGHNQHLILASELTAIGMYPGNITALALNTTTVAPLPIVDYSVKIGNTTATSLTSFVTTPLTTVFTAANYFPEAGIGYMNFSTPFYWDGVSNIVIEFCNGNSANTTTKYPSSSNG